MTTVSATGTISFNPRPRAAGDLIRAECRRMKKVSIHARAQRATFFDYLALLVSCRFNPRPRAAGDFPLPQSIPLRQLFQSTPARSGRLLNAAGAGTAGLFQSTPARSGRRDDIRAAITSLRFNPRPRAAGDTANQHPGGITDMFQSTPARSGRQPGLD